MDIVSGLFAALTAGSGGGVLGGLFGGVIGLFKKHQDRKERVEMAKLEIMRDRMEAERDEKRQAHEIAILSKGGELELQKIQAETTAQVDTANQSALANAQDALGRLNTTPKMDNYRASVRPTLAYWAALVFSAMGVWAFYEYSGMISPETGGALLTGVFATIGFTLNSVIAFYYVSRPSSIPR